MLETILTVVATAVLAAVLSSLLTGWLLRRGFETRLKPELERELDARLRTAVDGLGDVIQERVRQGVLDAVKELPTSNFIKEAQRSVTRTASDLVQEGLGSLLGVERRKRGEE